MRRVLFAAVLLAGVWMLASARVHSEPPSAPGSTPGPAAASLELVLLGDDKLSRVELLIEVDGRAASEIWAETFARLFTFFDFNGDGSLDDNEIARLPSAFALRQPLWGQSVPYTGHAVTMKELDTNSDGKVSKDELAGYYRGAGLGQMLVGVGRPLNTAALTAALLKSLDTDGDRTVSEAEWKAAADTLRKLDRNDDELIGPGELVPKISYPGTLGANILSPPTASDASGIGGIPVIVLPVDPANVHWATALVARRDRDKDGKLDAKEAGLPPDVFGALDTNKDGKLSPAELALWRKHEPAARYTFRLGKRGKDQADIVRPAVPAFATGRVRFDTRADEGKARDQVALAHKRLLDRFADADANADGFVDEMELTKRNHYDLKQLLIIADCNGDGKLSKDELVAWLDLQNQIASGHVLVTILDYEAGLFELLDENRDGSLSILELRRAWDRVKECGCIASDGKFDAANLPRQLVLTASRGHPVNPLGSTKRAGPTWFVAMDRNGDGYVSRREWTGPAELFDKIDLDKDGFISPEEADKAEKLPTKPEK